MTKFQRVWAVMAAGTVVLAGCSSGGHEGHSGSAESGEGDRTIEVTASDTLKFDPDSIEVEAGETITFVVTNEGDAQHEFVVGDEDVQAEHEEMMSDGHEMADSHDAITLAPGETKELTYTFEESGELQYACHEPGHYDGGMVGTITIQ